MQSLRRIETLPPSRRSSMIGQAGVLIDLRTIEKKEAIAWLERNISSPVTRDWGRLLVCLSADWQTLKTWMHIGKEHAVAAADAVDHYISTEEWPEGSSPSEVIAELERLVNLFKSLRFKTILDSVEAFLKPFPLSRKLLAAARILFGTTDLNIVLRDNEDEARWHSLLHHADGKHCVSVMDWKATDIELQRALLTLPIVMNSKNSSSTNLTFEAIDVGSDEVTLIALPFSEMKILKKLAPKSFRFRPYNIKANPSFNRTRQSGAD